MILPKPYLIKMSAVMSLKFFKHLDMVIFQVLDKKHGEVSDRTQAYGYI